MDILVYCTLPGSLDSLLSFVGRVLEAKLCLLLFSLLQLTDCDTKMSFHLIQW